MPTYYRPTKLLLHETNFEKVRLKISNHQKTLNFTINKRHPNPLAQLGCGLATLNIVFKRGP